jgi:hypothetical protein
MEVWAQGPTPSQDTVALRGQVLRLIVSACRWYFDTAPVLSHRVVPFLVGRWPGISLDEASSRIAILWDV